MKRTGKKMCNHWHLGGHCENGKFCQFQHEPKLTVGELNALRYKTRSLACKNRYCENIDCCKYCLAVIVSLQPLATLLFSESNANFTLDLGHQCALERDFGKCPYPDTCHLRATHGMDKTKFVRYDKDGNAEYA
jgi:hypothetical protein